MLRRFGHLLVVAALLAAIGGHWAILQSVAWATMLTDNLRTSSITEAVSNTFDGEHPCAMCKAIKQGRAEEKQQDKQQVKTGLKIEFGPVWQAAALTLERAREWVASSDDTLTINREGPPKPRPRATVPTVIS